ncbi:ATP-binding protein [Daejeonella sp.]|uniref:AAA family ATPase n=1 Tax=Daejeonella sp. TaxID=2805397 RepID=UPI0025C127CB|nr:ATP-binding protein [Daejeonella sp.]
MSLQATSIKDHPDNPPIITERYKLLKGAVIYGANASGKSNFVKAMSTMRRLVLKSFEKSSTQDLDITPFLLHTGSESEPSLFEVLFLVNNIRYRYGFEVDNTSVRSEWLFEAKKNIEKPLFIRESDGIEVFPTFKEGKDLEEKTRDNTLFLAVVDQFNGTISKAIMQWFNNFITISGLSHESYKAVTFKMLENEDQKPVLQNFYNRLDLGFDDIKIVKKTFDPNELPKDLPEALVKQMVTDFEGKTFIGVKTLHKKYNDKNEIEMLEEFDMRSQESSGTNKIFNISGPIFDVLSDGGVLIIDELDASLHPLLTLAVTKLFNSKEHNLKNAQLVFSTHDTNLLYYGNYRRDQVFFVEKDIYGASDLYSLADYSENGKKIRNDSSFEKDYIQGRYGAIPYIGDIKTLLNKWPEK